MVSRNTSLESEEECESKQIGRGAKLVRIGSNPNSFEIQGSFFILFERYHGEFTREKYHKCRFL